MRNDTNPPPPDAPERQEQDDLFESWWFRNKCKTKDLKVMAIHAYDAGLAAQHPDQWRYATTLTADECSLIRMQMRKVIGSGEIGMVTPQEKLASSVLEKLLEMPTKPKEEKS